MIIVTFALLTLLICCVIEFALKIRWLKVALNCIIVGLASIATFRIGLETGSTIERVDNARLVGDTLEYLEEATRSNTLSEVQARLEVVGDELPKAILSKVPTTPRLLKALDQGNSRTNFNLSIFSEDESIQTNGVSQKLNHEGGAH